MKIKEEYVFKLAEDTIKDINTGAGSRAVKLARDLNADKPSLRNLLMNYYFLKRGQVKDPSVREKDITFHDHISGKVNFTFQVEYALGCSDSGYVDEDQMSFNFAIDKKARSITLEEISFPERDRDEI